MGQGRLPLVMGQGRPRAGRAVLDLVLVRAAVRAQENLRQDGNFLSLEFRHSPVSASFSARHEGQL